MPWLWYVSPFVAVLIYVLTSLPGRHERRRGQELALWEEYMTPERTEIQAGTYRSAKEAKVAQAGPQQVARLPNELHAILPDLGGGSAIAHYELLDKLGYVAIMGPDLGNGSEYQAVVARLESPAPEMRVLPLAIVEGKRVPNTGVSIKKDPELMALFQVEGRSAKGISRWLTRRTRAALKGLPEAWLYTRGRIMALVLYGPVDADRLYALVEAADAIFAEHGDEGGPSLFLDEDDADKDEEADDDEEADGGEEAEASAEEAAPAEAAAPKRAKAASPAARPKT
jgi:hypothetical protein